MVLHEVKAVQSIVSRVLDEATKQGAARIVRVSIKSGEWSTMDPDCVRTYFDQAAKGTMAEGAEVVIESVPVRFKCSDCGTTYSPAKVKCPNCSGTKGELTSGREFFVESIEVAHA